MVYSSSFSHNFSVAVGALCCCKRDPVRASSSYVFQEDGDTRTANTAEKRLLVFVNPRSGAGRSEYIFNKQVAPKLAANGIKYDLVLTERQNHARSYMMSLKDFHLYNALLIVSGDGLVFEIINASLERPDALTLPIGIIPSGSGNGLLSSVSYFRGYSLKQHEFLKRAINNVCDFHAVAYPVNLMHVETPTKSYAAIISVGFGLFADIDIESEKWRRTLASARFTAEALVRFFNLRIYRCRLSYLPTNVNGDARNFVSPEVLQVYCGPPHANKCVIESDFPSLPNEFECSNSNLRDFLKQAYFQNNIPKVTEPVPSDWVVIEDEFLFIYALSVSHAGQDVPFTPDAQLFDRSIYLTYALKKDLRHRIDLLRFLSDIKHAKHLTYSFLKIVPVKAFRFEKLETPKVGGYTSVDGEVVECDVLQATNTSRAISVVTV